MGENATHDIQKTVELTLSATLGALGIVGETGTGVIERVDEEERGGSGGTTRGDVTGEPLPVSVLLPLEVEERLEVVLEGEVQGLGGEVTDDVGGVSSPDCGRSRFVTGGESVDQGHVSMIECRPDQTAYRKPVPLQRRSSWHSQRYPCKGWPNVRSSTFHLANTHSGSDDDDSEVRRTRRSDSPWFWTRSLCLGRQEKVSDPYNFFLPHSLGSRDCAHCKRKQGRDRDGQLTFTGIQKSSLRDAMTVG